MNKERLLKLADHLETGQLIHERFNFQWFNFGLRTNPPIAGCGSIGCAIGEMPGVFPEDWAFQGNRDEDITPQLRIGSSGAEFEDARIYFSLDHMTEVFRLFSPIAQYPELFGGIELDHNATKEQVAANIRAFVARKEQDAQAQINH